LVFFFFDPHSAIGIPQFGCPSGSDIPGLKIGEEKGGKILLDRIFLSAIMQLIKLSETMTCLPYYKFWQGAYIYKLYGIDQKKFAR